MLEKIYKLTEVGYLDSLMCLDTPFMRQLATLGVEQTKNNKMLSVELDNALCNRTKNGVSAVLDIKKLPSLSGGYANLKEEVATYRAKSIGLVQEGDLAGESFIQRNADVLFLDYLLASSVCYVEIIDNGKVDKFLATKNRMLAGHLCEKSEEETRKYVNHLTSYSSVFESKQLSYLKININKKGKSITQPRGYIDLTKKVKITPLFFINIYLKRIMELLSQGFVKFTYIKDNLTEREFVSTLNEGKMSQYYSSEMVAKMKGNYASKLSRGYVKLPEMGISQYDVTGARSLNVSRLISVEVVDSFDTRFIDVDFSLILNAFVRGIQNCEDINMLVHIYTEFVGKPPLEYDIAIIQSELVSYIESQHIIGTTTLLRQLHLYMLNYPQVFKGYDGKSANYGLSNTVPFNLGLD